MKRSITAAADIVVRKYPVRKLDDWGDDIDVELRRANALWNMLVELHKAAQERYNAATADDVDVAAAEGKVADLAARLEELSGERKRQRRSSRSRQVAPQLGRDIAEVKASLRIARQTLKAAQVVARDRVKEVLQTIEQDRAKASDEARRKAVAGGLYWGTANAVASRFQAARKVILDIRRAGKLADFGFSSYRGDGLIHNQIQGGITVAQLAAGTRAARLSPNGGASDAQFSVTAYTVRTGEERVIERWRSATPDAPKKRELVTTRGPGEPRLLTGHVKAYRPLLPPGVKDDELQIKDVELVLRRNPFFHPAMSPRKRFSNETSLVVTGTTAAGKTLLPHGDEVLSINLGWRLTDDGLRVATAVSDSGRETEYLLLPREWLSLAERAEQLRAERDKARDAILPRLRAIPWNLAPPAISEEGMRLAASPAVSCRRLWMFVFDWKISAPEWMADDLVAFRFWRLSENKLRDSEAKQRSRFQEKRNYLYRAAAKRWCERARIILTDATDRAALQRLPVDDDPVLPAAARRYRVLAANSDLMHWISNAAMRRAVEIIEQPGPSTWVWCHHGDHPLVVPVELRAELRYYCGRCREWLDQDDNNARVRLARYLSGAPVPPELPGALAAE